MERSLSTPSGNRAGLLASAAVLLIGAYGIHLYLNYAKIQARLRALSGVRLHAKVDNESVSEIGYIFEMRRDMYIREGGFNIVWFIDVPSTNRRYSCAYGAGFQGFREGDGVQIIHKSDDVDHDDYTGYVIGLHEGEKGKVSEVDAWDLDDLEMMGAD
jgi:hypothetical protein